VKKVLSFSYSPPPVGLHGNDLTVKETLNKGLEFLKLLEDLRLMLEKIDPSEETYYVDQSWSQKQASELTVIGSECASTKETRESNS
jgi:hypothetical protein